MPRKRIVPQSEMIRAIVVEISPCLWGPAPERGNRRSSAVSSSPRKKYLWHRNQRDDMQVD